MEARLNMAEIEIAILERNALSRRLPDEAALRRQVSVVEAVLLGNSPRVMHEAF
jgi:hypothetical protein